MALEALLQIGDAVAGQLVPTIEQGSTLALACTFYDSVTLLEVAPTTVTAVVQAPDGTQQSPVVTGPTSPAQAPYTASLTLAQVGTYTVKFTGVLGAVTTLAEGQVNVTASAVGVPVPTGAIQMPTFNQPNITPSQSPFTLTSFVAAPVDCRQGPVALVLPPIAGAGTIPVLDVYNASGAPAPAGPITLSVAPGDVAGGTLCEDPGSPGTFAPTVHISSPGGRTVWFQPMPLQNVWKIIVDSA